MHTFVRIMSFSIDNDEWTKITFLDFKLLIKSEKLQNLC